MSIHEKYMGEAIIEAKKALSLGEVPVGAVIVKDDIIIGRGHNKKEVNHDPISHAEIEAIKDACSKTGNWRLNGSSIYVTVEPCIMCSGAIIHARIDKLYFGIKESKFGGVVSKANIFDITLNHKTEWISSILEEESMLLIQDFFKSLRK